MDKIQQQFLIISYLNIRGQTGLHLDKQYQIEEFLKRSNSDILHLQEANIEENTFAECNYIESNFTVITNNAENKYGTASIVRNDLEVKNVMCDTNGRVLVFDISGITFGNFYLPSGTDGLSRNRRENYCSEIIPQILLNCQLSGCVGGDFNCITNKADASNHPEGKMSPSLKRLLKTFEWKDSFRALHPNISTFSRYYETRGTAGGTRIDRQYHWGQIDPVNAEYTPLLFSDHLAHTIKINLPEPLARMCSQKSRPLFKEKRWSGTGCSRR